MPCQTLIIMSGSFLVHHLQQHPMVSAFELGFVRKKERSVMILNGTCKTVPTYLQSGWVHTQMPFLHMFTPKGSLAFSETTDL